MFERADVALFISVIGFLILVTEKAFGGGNKLATKFSDHSTKTTETVSALRTEIFNKIAEIDNMYRVGLDAIGANLHRTEIAILTMRADFAENYMRRESFYKATDDLKRDFKEANNEIKANMKDGFNEVTKELDGLAQAIEAARKSNNRRNTNP